MAAALEKCLNGCDSGLNVDMEVRRRYATVQSRSSPEPVSRVTYMDLTMPSV